MRRGRREELARLAFASGTEVPDPQDPATFTSAKIGWSWPEHSFAGQLRRLYQDLLAARRGWPALGDRRHTSALVIRVGEMRKGTVQFSFDRTREKVPMFVVPALAGIRAKDRLKAGLRTKDRLKAGLQTVHVYRGRYQRELGQSPS